MASTVVSFGEWLPDQPVLGNEGLTVANNVVADIGFYRPYQPLANYAATLPGTAVALLNAYDDAGSLSIFYGATAGQLFVAGVGGSNFTARSASLSAASLVDWTFAQYDNLVFAANYDNVVYHTVRATSNFLVSDAPPASVVSVFKRFVIVGDLNDGTQRPNVIQWSAIDQPTNWPDPNTSTAIATQSGEQILNKAFGRVNGISAGDQHAIVLQDFGITRMTYVGPPVVFQFDEIDTLHGGKRQAFVRAGALTYFFSNSTFSCGFYATDGVNITPIGEGKVNDTFKRLLGSAIVRAFYNTARETVNWSFSSTETTSTTVPNKIYSFHIPTSRWTSADEQLRAVDTSIIGSNVGPYAFDENNIVSLWNNATAGSATITTGDLELNPGGRAFVNGVKPNIESTGTAPAITVRVGARSDLGTSPAYTATTTPTTRTGFADVRVDAKYHRAEVQLVGNFDKAVGIEFKAFLTGET